MGTPRNGDEARCPVALCGKKIGVKRGHWAGAEFETKCPRCGATVIVTKAGTRLAD